jgi:hypothetical protein
MIGMVQSSMADLWLESTWILALLQVLRQSEDPAGPLVIPVADGCRGCTLPGEILSWSSPMGIETLEAIKPSCQGGSRADGLCMLPATEYCAQCGAWFCHTHFSDDECHECVLMAARTGESRGFNQNE